MKLLGGGDQKHYKNIRNALEIPGSTGKIHYNKGEKYQTTQTLPDIFKNREHGQRSQSSPTTMKELKSAELGMIKPVQT